MAYNLGLIGYPVQHSFFSYIYSYFLSKYEINGGYNTFSLKEKDELPVLMHFLERFGFMGLNVTAPHSKTIIEHAQNVDDTVRKTGVVNTFKLEREGWRAYNTDMYGFSHMLDIYDVALEGKNILVAGAGGAASTVLSVLQDRGVRSLSIVNRSEERAAQLRCNFTEMNISYFRYQSLKDKLTFDIVINCSAADWAHPIWLDHFWGADEEIFEGHIPHTVIDLQYYPENTGFLSRWKSPQKINGFVMLVAQAAKAFEIWFGILPEYSLEELRQIVYKGE